MRPHPPNHHLAHLVVQLLVALVAAVAALALSADTAGAQDPPRASAQARGGDAPKQNEALENRQAPKKKKAAKNKPAAKRAPAGDGGTPAAGNDPNERLGRDPFDSLGGHSPFCRRRGLGRRERANCKASGALAHPQEITHYGFDIRIDTGLDNIGGNIAAALQTFVQLLWMGLLFVVKAVTLLLEWSFSLDLLSEAMASVKKALLRLHRDVFGQAWFLAAISAAGLWAIWRGFVQRKTIQTATGLAATVALMVVALVIINDPVGTVGRANQLANQSSLGIVSGATTGTVSGSARGFGEAMTRVFDQVALRPWCALQFSDVEFCLSNPRKVIPAEDIPDGGDDDDIKEAYETSATVAEMWLTFEPNGKDDVDQRKELYDEWKEADSDQGKPLESRTRMQKEGSTGPRIALFGLIAIGMLGMICLFGWIGLRLLGYAVLSLVLVLFAPIALLMAALGDSGRQSFVGWAKRLLGALVAKAIYAIFLALVLVASAALAELDSLGFMAVWLLQSVFWWTLFLKRDELMQFVSAPGLGPQDQQNKGSLFQRLYYGAQAATMAKRAGSNLADKARRPVQKTADAYGARRAKTAQATGHAAESQARERARARLEQGHDQARETVARDDAASASLGKVDQGLRAYDERAETARAQGKPDPAPQDHEALLLARRNELQARRAPAPVVGAAREQVRHADVNRARTGSPVTAADEHAQIARRRQEIKTLPATHDKNLAAAGVDPAAYRAAGAVERKGLERRVAQSLEKEAAVLAAVPDTTAPTKDGAPAAPSAKSSELRHARRALETDQLREARSADNAQRRAQRRAARQRERLAPRGRR